MADEILNTGPAENISPEAAEPITTPEQAAASEPRQEQTGPAIPEPGDVVVSFDKINELTQTQNILSRFIPARPTMPLERTTAPSIGLTMTPFTAMCCGKSGNVPELP